MEVQWRSNLQWRGNSGKRRRTIEGVAAEDWASIPGDLLRLIASKIDSIDDYLRFSVVCCSWYSIASDYYDLDRKFHLLTPLLMSGMDPDPRLGLPTSPFVNPGHQPKLAVTFTSYTTKRSFDLYLPEVAGRRCWGSPFGWLVTLGPVDLQFTLVNPFTRATIALPSLLNLCPALPPNFIYLNYHGSVKAFLTANPSDDNCFVFVAFQYHRYQRDWILAFCRPYNDNAWCRVQARTTSNMNDVVCFNGKFYGIQTTRDFQIVVVSIRIQPSPRAIRCATIKLVRGDSSSGLGRPGFDANIDLHPGGKIHAPWKYLVEIKGELHVVLRYISSPGTVYFKLFHIDLPAKKVTRVWTLGDHCLFVGNQYSFAFRASSPPPEVFERLEHPPDRFRSNYIFYTFNDDTRVLTTTTLGMPRCPDVGVWDMLHSDKVYSYGSDALTTYPALWIIRHVSFRRLKESGVMNRCSSIQ